MAELSANDAELLQQFLTGLDDLADATGFTIGGGGFVEQSGARSSLGTLRRVNDHYVVDTDL